MLSSWAGTVGQPCLGTRQHSHIIRENVHQVGSILFEKKFIIIQLAMFDLLLRFDHYSRPSSGIECSVVTARYMSHVGQSARHAI